jgi:hypothetical protein
MRNETKHCCVREHDEGGKRNSNPVLTMVNGRRRWKEEARVGWRERESPSDLASGYIYLREERRVRAWAARDSGLLILRMLSPWFVALYGPEKEWWPI